MQHNKSISHLTTFGVPVNAARLVSVDTTTQLKELLAQPEVQSQPKLLLGGGSNMLFIKDWEGLVISNQILGIDLVEESENEVVIKVGAGENWHELVMQTIDKGWFGLENLSLIPGKVGASPIQNIGAYGVELKDVFVKLDGVHVTGNKESFIKDQCEFGYRDSIFKRHLKGKFYITHVYLKLSKLANVNTNYGPIKAELERLAVATPTPKDVSTAVINIRQSKLPDPKDIGNGGSFFKNPVISVAQFQEFNQNWPDAPNYPAPNGKVKVPAGWLIEQAGWKGKTFGSYGVHKKQALVLVNYGGATGQQIYDLSTQIIEDIQSKFGITLEREVNMIL